MSPKTLLDTDTVTALTKRNPGTEARERRYRRDHARVSTSAYTRFEVERGWRAIGATAQLSGFRRFCASAEVLPLDDAVLYRAAEICAHLHRAGNLIIDGDIPIAATAIVHGLTLATNNTRYFARIDGLILDNWLS